MLMLYSSHTLHTEDECTFTILNHSSKILISPKMFHYNYIKKESI